MRSSSAFWIFVALTIAPAPAYAQRETFVQAVRELVTTPITTQNAAMRMDAAIKQWDEEITAVEERVRNDLRSAPDLRAAQLRIELGVVYRQRGRLADAVREFDASIRLRPSGSDVRVLRALSLEALGRPAEAAQSFQDAWTLDANNAAKAYYVASRPGIDQAARTKARAFLMNYLVRLKADTTSNRPFVVIDVIPDSFGLTPIVGDETTAEPFALLAGGKYKEAVAALARAGRAAPEKRDSPRLHFARGQAAESLNRVPDARREYQMALGGALAGRSIILVAIGRLAQVDGDLGGAIEALTHAALLNPNDSLVRHELAAALAADGRIDDAFVELAAAVIISPRDAQAYAAIGQLHLAAARDAEAVAAFTRALELAPDRYELRYSLATAYERMGDSTQAAKELEVYDRARRAAVEERRRVIANETAQGK